MESKIYKIMKNDESRAEQIGALLSGRRAAMEKRYPSISSMIGGLFGTGDPGSGSVAVDETGHVTAWMNARKVPDETWGDFLVAGIGDYLFADPHSGCPGGAAVGDTAVSPAPGRRALMELYGSEFGGKTRGTLEHRIFCPACETELLRFWFELGFGMEQAYGFAPIDLLGGLPKPGGDIVIEPLNGNNRAAFESFFPIIAMAHARPPVWAGAPESYLDDLRKGFRELFDDRESMTIVAMAGGRAAGYQVWRPEKGEAIELAVSGTLPGERGKGIGRALTAFGAGRAAREGYRVCLTDWKTANPLSSTFFPSIGFEPYLYRLVRRFTPDIIDDGEKVLSGAVYGPPR